MECQSFTVKNTRVRYADVTFVQVKCNSDGACSCVLIATATSTFELQGELMYTWLREWSQRWRAPKTTPRNTWSRTSKESVLNDLQTQWAWLHEEPF